MSFKEDLMNDIDGPVYQCAKDLAIAFIAKIPAFTIEADFFSHGNEPHLEWCKDNKKLTVRFRTRHTMQVITENINTELVNNKVYTEREMPLEVEKILFENFSIQENEEPEMEIDDNIDYRWQS